MLNKQKGNMYPWVTHTWNAIKGKCPHDCSYCYMKRFPLNEVRFDDKELNTNLGKQNTIFVGSSCDMWAEQIPTKWIIFTLEHCKKYPDNIYLFQSKNPSRFDDFILPSKVILGATMETNWVNAFSVAPSVFERHHVMKNYQCRKMISIEPIMAFDLKPFVKMIHDINPSFVSIGADSQGHDLPEPSSIEVKQLIKALNQFTEVKVKDNLRRIIEG